MEKGIQSVRYGDLAWLGGGIIGESGLSNLRHDHISSATIPISWSWLLRHATRRGSRPLAMSVVGLFVGLETYDGKIFPATSISHEWDTLLLPRLLHSGNQKYCFIRYFATECNARCLAQLHIRAMCLLSGVMLSKQVPHAESFKHVPDMSSKSGRGDGAFVKNGNG